VRHREPRRPGEYRPDARFENSQRYAREVEVLAREPDRPLPSLSDDERLLVRVGAICERWPSVDRHRYGKELASAFRELRPICAAPQSNVPTDDLIRAWSQPEAHDLWPDWWNPEIGSAYAPAYEGSKAAMVTTAGLKRGPHIKGGWDVLVHSPNLQDHFEQLARAAGRGLEHGPAMIVREYSACTRHLKRLSEGFPEKAMRASVNIVRASRTSIRMPLSVSTWRSMAPMCLRGARKRVQSAMASLSLIWNGDIASARPTRTFASSAMTATDSSIRKGSRAESRGARVSRGAAIRSFWVATSSPVSP
jgi:hypothetical protein